MTPNDPFPENIRERLQLLDDDGDYYATVGITLTLMYAQRKHEMAPHFNQMICDFGQFIQPAPLNWFIRGEDWRKYSPEKLSRLLAKFSTESAESEELVIGRLGDRFQRFGEFNVRVMGYGYEKDSTFRDSSASALYFEFPRQEMQRSGRAAFLDFIAKTADITPFTHGQCGYAFQYFHRQGDQNTYDWMADNMLRFSAIHPFRETWEYYCRNYLPNVNWLTLLGYDMMDKLGGLDAIRADLSDQVEVRPLAHGCMLVAGEAPPLGDVNQQAPDLGPLREVARLTEPLLLPRIDQSNNILNSFWYEEEDRMRWLDRFKPYPDVKP